MRRWSYSHASYPRSSYAERQTNTRERAINKQRYHRYRGRADKSPRPLQRVDGVRAGWTTCVECLTAGNEPVMSQSSGSSHQYATRSNTCLGVRRRTSQLAVIARTAASLKTPTCRAEILSASHRFAQASQRVDRKTCNLEVCASQGADEPPCVSNSGAKSGRVGDPATLRRASARTAEDGGFATANIAT